MKLLLLFTTLLATITADCDNSDNINCKQEEDEETQLFQSYQKTAKTATNPDPSPHPLSTELNDAPAVDSLVPGASFRLEAEIDGVAHFHVRKGNLIPFWKRGKKFAESVVNDINITLENAYHGYTQDANWIRSKVCTVCNGRGATAEHLKPCQHCHGTGTLHASHDHSCFYSNQDDSNEDSSGLHYHFTQTVDVSCPTCDGKGEVLRTDGHQCHRCNGKGLIDEFIQKKVVVPRGAQDGHLIFFEGDGNENLETKAATIICRVHIIEHPMFTREGDDLMIAVNISLKEALLGFNRTITHLNGTSIEIIHDDITTPGQEFRWESMGMPIITQEDFHGDAEKNNDSNDDDSNDDDSNDDDSNDSVAFGNLVMSVHVVLPERLKDHQTQAFRSALSGQ